MHTHISVKGARVNNLKNIVNFSDCPHSGAGVLAGGLLVDGNGRGQPVNVVHVRLLHLPQEHSGIGAE